MIDALLDLPAHLRQRLAGALRAVGAHASDALGLLAFAAVGVALTMALAVCVFFAFERPFLGLKRHFEYGRGSGRAS